MFQAKDIMEKNVVTVTPEDGIGHAISLLLAHGVGGLPVIDETGRLEGLISDADVLKAMYDGHSQEAKVRDCMSPSPLTAEADCDLVWLADTFLSHSARRIPLVHDGRLVGIVTRRDLVHFMHQARTYLQRTPSEEAASDADSDTLLRQDGPALLGEERTSHAWQRTQADQLVP
jgi:CBS domain-containing protein